VSEISNRFSRGISTPAIRAMFVLVLSLDLALALLVARVLTDDLDATVPADHAALLAHGFDARSDLHDNAFIFRLTCIDT
jgi:hypothetical protein